MRTLFFREGRVLALSALMIVVLGLSAFAVIGRQEDPTITVIFANIVTPFPGADPARVEALVTEKIEAELRGIPEIKNILSTSRTGVSVIRIELSEFTPRDRLEQVWSEIRDALADAATQLPPGVPEPEFDNDRFNAFTSISALSAANAEAAPSMAVLTRYAFELRDRIQRLSGTDLVRVYGAADEELVVEIDPDRLAALGLTVADVSRAVAEADVKTPAGRVRGPRNDYLIEISGEIDSLERVRRIPLSTSGDGRVVRLEDVATVTRGAQAPPEQIARINGERAVLIASRMQADLQVDAWMARVRAEMESFEQTLPPSVAHRQTFDQSAYTFERLTEVVINLALGVAIVVAVLLVTLGWRSALLVGATLPLASLMSLFALERMGVSIHQMSVTGLIVALGLLVDAAIVMTDDIRRRLNEGASRLAAVEQAVRRLAAPLLASTITTILAFVPMAGLPGPAGDFVGSIAVAVMTMLVASLLLALTVTPALAGRILRATDPSSVKPKRLTWAQRAYLFTLRLSLRWRLAAAALAATPAVIGFMSFGTLTAQFFPGVERDQFHVQVTLAEGASILETAEVARRIDEALRRDASVRDVAWVVGESAPAFYYNMQAERDNSPNFAEALVTVATEEDAARLTRTLQPILDAVAPEAQTLVRALVQGPPVAAPLEMRIIGPSVEVLRRLGEEAQARMTALPVVTHVRADVSGGAPTLVFDLDEDRVRLAGLTLDAAASQLSALLEGVEGGSLVEGTEELPVRVRVSLEDRSAAERVLDLLILPPNAREVAAAGGFPGVPLSALGRARLAPSESAISRRNGERINTVQAFLPPDVLPEEALADLRASLERDPLALPEGYRIEWGGDSDARNEVINNLLSTVSLVVALTVATILLTFNSWRLSMIVFIVCAQSFGLSILSLAIFQYPFGIVALLGVIGSIGVSINAAIIIMSALKDDEVARTGDPEAVARVVMGASRHIVSTTITTFGGFVPLILAGGGFWPPFAVAIAGGVLLSTIVSLYFTPPMFSLLAGRSGYGRTEPARDQARDAAGATAAGLA